MPRRCFSFPLAFCAAAATAQVNVPVNGPHDVARPVEAFVHATLHPSPGITMLDATLLIQGDHILAVGQKVEVPKGAIIHDLRGLHLWPALIDPYSDLGMPAADRTIDDDTRGAHYWNPAVRPARDASELFISDEERARKLREAGIGMVVTHRQDGIARGTSAAVLLAGRSAQEDVLLPQAAAQFSFKKGNAKMDYPSSLMGSNALLRQLFYDAAWYASAGSAQQTDVDLAALNAQRGLPQVFDAGEHNDVMRIARIGSEFGIHFIVKGNGDEYMRLDEVKVTGQDLILPFTLPEAVDVTDPFDAMEVSLYQLEHWEHAPFNAGLLQQAGVRFAFTTQGLKDPDQLWANLRRMVRCGLDSTAAIAAITTVPSELLHLDGNCGTLEPGKLASFLITTEHLLSATNAINETWVAGQRFVVKADVGDDLRGSYDLQLGDRVLRMEVRGSEAKPEVKLRAPEADTSGVKGELSRDGALITLSFDGEKLGISGITRLNGIAHRGSGIWDGRGQLARGGWIPWNAVREAGAKKDEEKRGRGSNELDSLLSAPPGPITTPFGAYGSMLPFDSATIIFRHATVWTNTAAGNLYDTDLCVHRGRIKAVGKSLDAAVLFPEKKKPVITEIDARGKHLTCGIIDEHSHIAIARGVNEGGQAISAEVRVADVIDPEAVNIYRNLAGGVTAAQLLHGSANPIGGQSALVKMRWGADAEGMKIDSAAGFIKFALGENVKQAFSEGSSRYPRTRMGVEQLMYDAFFRARAYDREWAAWRATLKPPPKRGRAKPAPVAPSPRRDLELDALAEILRSERFITCHSYVQAEVLMLMRLADSLGFHVNTFTHILEGYKVADKMRAHGVSASTFGDWWAYKFEVYDALPQNATLLHDAGVNTCINSDDAEMARRLNQEAAKSVKYGGMSEVEAWKMVTLNPARALHLDARMGTVEAGKDADLVLWSADPLSIDAHCEMTLVDGTVRFDQTRDAALRVAMQVERERLIAKMLAAKKAGAGTQSADHRERPNYECETIGP